MRRNYFKVFHPADFFPERFFFFDNTKEKEVASAYGQALAYRSRDEHLRICVWHPIPHEGAWSDVPIIGHRAPATIAEELSEALAELPLTKPQARHALEIHINHLEAEKIELRNACLLRGAPDPFAMRCAVEAMLP